MVINLFSFYFFEIAHNKFGGPNLKGQFIVLQMNFCTHKTKNGRNKNVWKKSRKIWRTINFKLNADYRN